MQMLKRRFRLFKRWSPLNHTPLPWSVERTDPQGNHIGPWKRSNRILIGQLGIQCCVVFQMYRYLWKRSGISKKELKNQLDESIRTVEWQSICNWLYIYIYIYIYIRGAYDKFPDFYVWALLLIVHTWNSTALRSNLLRLQCTSFIVPTTSRRPHGSPLVWACQWLSSQPLSSLTDDSLWA